MALLFQLTSSPRRFLSGGRHGHKTKPLKIIIVTRSMALSFNLFHFFRGGGRGSWGERGEFGKLGELRNSEVKLMVVLGGMRGLPSQSDLDSVAFSCL